MEFWATSQTRYHQGLNPRYVHTFADEDAMSYLKRRLLWCSLETVYVVVHWFYSGYSWSCPKKFIWEQEFVSGGVGCSAPVCSGWMVKLAKTCAICGECVFTYQFVLHLPWLGCTASSGRSGSTWNGIERDQRSKNAVCAKRCAIKACKRQVH